MPVYHNNNPHNITKKNSLKYTFVMVNHVSLFDIYIRFGMNYEQVTGKITDVRYVGYCFDVNGIL